MPSMWIVASLGPPLLLIGYGVFKARESWLNPALWCAFITGMIGALLAVGIEAWLGQLLGIKPELMMTANPMRAGLAGFVIAGATEETVKMIGLLLAMMLLDEKRLRSVLMIAVAVAMGFAGFENVLYVVGAGRDWQSVALLRGGAAVPIHGVCGLMMGAIIVGTIANDFDRLAGLMLAWLVPVMLHGTYDSLLLLTAQDFAPWKLPTVVVAMLLGGVMAVALANNAILAVASLADETDAGGPIKGFLRVLVTRAARSYLCFLFIPVAVGGFQLEAVWTAGFLAVLPTVLTGDILFARLRSPVLSRDRRWITVREA